MTTRALKWFIALVPVLIAGCGGGGGGTDGPPAPQDQTISFDTRGTVTGAAGTTVTNTASGGAGTGAITYSSNNITVATVNATTGVATLNAVGTATITAVKSASSGFNQATTSYTLNVTQGTQTIAFAQAGPFAVLKGFTVTNTASGGTGTGAITYASSDPAVASVNSASGLVLGASTGTTTITATKAADANFAQAQTTYTVNVQTQARMSAWVGSNDTQVSLPAIANGGQLIRSRDRNCNIATYSLCTSGQANTVNGALVTDTAATTNNTGYYVLQGAGGATNPLTVSTSRFSERIGHTALRFNNRYWVIGGGFTASASAKNDVWSSADGKTWELETNSAAFSPRWFHQSVVYNGKMWVIGGISTANGLANDVWSSTDGRTWTQVAASTPFNTASHTGLNVTVFNNAMWAVFAGSSYSSTDGLNWTLRSTAGAIGGFRAWASLTAFNGKLWYVGGVPNFVEGSSGTAVNDVWSSTNGVTWQQVSGGFAPRFRHAAFTMNNRLWIFGGQSVSAGVVGAVTPDAWSTGDGTTWTQEATTTELDRSALVAAVQESDKVTLIGGSTRAFTSKAWQSNDGSRWVELTSFAQFSPRSNAQLVSFLGDLWMIGGTAAESLDSNEIWRSSDGLNWTRVIPVGSVFSPRDGHQAIVFNGRIWVLGGWDGLIGNGGTETRTNEVWSSADGINWTQHAPSGAVFSPRHGLRAVVFNNKLFVVGGNTGTTANANDVWSTTDGITWVRESSSAAFPARSYHGVVAFNNSLWLFGGQDSATAYGDIWRSTDGVVWTPVTPSGSAFAPRSGHGMAVYNNRIWLIAGWNGLDFRSAAGFSSDYYVSTRFGDVWSTADGVSWRLETGAAQFEKRLAPAMANHNNELWVIGGLNFDRFNDVWRSTDGVNWRVGYQQTFTTP